MTLLIHDLPDTDISRLKLDRAEMTVIAPDVKHAPCKGCFGCWLKTPGQCVLGDSLRHLGALFSQCSEVIIISRNCYGGYSQHIKGILDRSISTFLPFFTYRAGELHHRRRYKNAFSLTVGLYGDFTELEKETARKMVEANRINMGVKNARLLMAASPAELKGF